MDQQDNWALPYNQEDIDAFATSANYAWTGGDLNLMQQVAATDTWYQENEKEFKERFKKAPSSNLEKSLQQEDEALNYTRATGDFNSNLEEINLQDREYRHNKLSKAIHDLTYLDSAEQHLIDLADRKNSKDKNTIFDINEARQYAKEQGVTNWNAKDRETISKFDLDLELGREKLRTQLQQEIALYQSYGDYTKLEQIRQMGSAISGGFGAAELVATIGLGWLTGWGAAAGLSRLATTLPAGVSIVRGVNTARKMELAQKVIKTNQAITKEIKTANDIKRTANAIEAINYRKNLIPLYQEAIAKEDIGAKLGYDMYRFGRTSRTMQLGGPGHLEGARASLATTMIPFAIDGAISMVPHITAQKIHNNVFQTGEYTNKDMLLDIFAGAGFGAAMPVAGTVLKAVGTVAGKGLGKAGGMAWETIDNAVGKVKDKINEKQAQAFLKDHQAEIEKLNLDKTHLDMYVDDLAKILTERHPFNAQEVANKLKEMNLTDQETMDMLCDAISVQATGIRKDIEIPPRTQWMTTVSGLYDIATQAMKEGGDIDYVFNKIVTELKNKNINILRTSTMKHGKTVSEELEELYTALNYGQWNTKVKFSGEDGYLGKDKWFAGITHAQAEELMKYTYIAQLFPDTELGQIAKVRMFEMQDKLIKIRNQISYIQSLYNKIAELNKDIDNKSVWQEAEALLKDIYKQKGQSNYVYKKAYSPMPLMEQQYAYKLMNGQWGYVNDAFKEILEELIPERIKESYQKALEILKAAKESEVLKGHGTIKDIQAYKEAQQIKQTYENFIEKAIQNFTKTKTITKTSERTGETYTALITDFIPFHDKNTKIAPLEFFGNKLEEIIKNNENIINAEETYERLLPDLEKYIEENPAKEILNTSGAEQIKQEASTNRMNFYKIANDSEAKHMRLSTKMLQEEARANNPNNKNLNDTFKNILNLMKVSEKAQAKVGMYHLINLTDSILKLNNIMETDFSTFRNVLLSKIQESPVIKDLMSNYLGNLSEKYIDLNVPRYTKEYKKLFTEAFKEVLNEKGQVADIFGTIKIEEWINSSVENFEKYLRENPEDGLQKLLTKYSYNTETNTTKEAAESIANSIKQEQLVEGIMDPFIKSMVDNVMDYQYSNYHKIGIIYDFLDNCIKNPGQIDEILLGKITMTPIISDGASLSAEAMSHTDSEWQQFMIGLRKNDASAIKDGTIPEAIAKNKDFQPLYVYALDKKNWGNIQEAIYNSLRLIEGTLSEKEATLIKRQNNTRAYRVAQTYLDTAAGLKHQLYEVGSNKNKIVNLLNKEKMKDLQYYLTKDLTTSKEYAAIKNYVLRSKQKEGYNDITNFLEKFVNPTGNSQAELAEHNANLDFLIKLDLNKQFEHINHKGYNLNEVRDALFNNSIEKLIYDKAQNYLNNTIKKKKPTLEEAYKYAHKEITKACDVIENGFFGDPGVELSFLNKLRGEIPFAQNPNTAKYRAKFVEDLQQQIFYKNSNMELEDLKYFGYDSFESMFDGTIGSAKRAYAILKNIGDEPVQQIESMIEIAKTFANSIAPKAYGKTKSDKLIHKLGPSWESAVRFNMHNVCGTYSVPANNFQKWAQIIVRTVSAPMLMKAGLRSITDYNYQLQALINMGLASEGDLGARFRVGNMFFRGLTEDKDLQDQIFMNLMIRNDVLHSMQYNTSLGSGDILGSIASTGLFKNEKLNKYAPAIMKAQQASRWYTSTLLDRLALVGPLTNYNRTNAALTTMKAIGSFSDVSYKNMNQYLQQTLKRFAVSEYEWDNILSKKIIANARDYIQEMSGEVVPEHVSNYKMFFPEMVDKITDKELTKFMQDQKLVITDLSKQQYRQHLKDKASLLINSSADEMTSIPTSRVQGAMSAHFLPNTGPAFLFNTALQFQSFGAAINFYQWGRRLAANTVGDATFDHLAWQIFGNPSAAKTLPQFIAESALIECFVSEGIAMWAGKQRAVVNDQGEIQWDSIADKTFGSIGSACGFGNILVQAMLSGLMKAQGQGGGISLAIMPSFGHVLQSINRVKDAATKESTKGNRGGAIFGALGEDIADALGFPNMPFYQAAWSFIIGDYFKRLQYGDRAQAIQTQREHRGYLKSWVRHLSDTTGFDIPDNSTVFESVLGW